MCSVITFPKGQRVRHDYLGLGTVQWPLGENGGPMQEMVVKWDNGKQTSAPAYQLRKEGN